MTDTVVPPATGPVGVPAAGRLAGRAALVLGAGTERRAGVGAAVARRLAADGASVLAVDHRPGAAARTARDPAGPGRLEAFEGHARDPDTAEQMVAEAHRRLGRLDILVTDVHAGLVGGGLATGLDRWQELLDLNTTQVFLAVRAALPTIERTGGGSVICITSSAGSAFTGLHGLAYSAAMAAVNQFVRLTAVDHAERGVRCNAIVRGLIDDELVDDQLAALFGGDPDRARRELAALVPSGRLGRPDEVAAVAAFLATEAAHYVSGVLFLVDGGLGAQSLPRALWPGGPAPGD